MSPTETLRAAATLLRDTASNATPGAREVAHLAGIGTCVRNPDLSFCVTVEHGWVQEGDAAWIALMHPGLAAPLAAWLETCANDLADARHYVDEPNSCEHALAVARSILGRSS
jgi:hypothetical protein